MASWHPSRMPATAHALKNLKVPYGYLGDGWALTSHNMAPQNVSYIFSKIKIINVIITVLYSFLNVSIL